MKNVLVLFEQEWDQPQLVKLAMNGTTLYREGFDLFSFPSNAQLLRFDIFAFVEHLVRKYARVKLDAIISSQEQFGALSAALLGNRLGLPTASTVAILNAQHKALARDLLQREAPYLNVPYQAFPYQVRRAEDIHLPFPLFAKPVKAAYSVLARRVDDFADLRTHLDFRPWESFIIKRLVRPFNDVVEHMGATEINGHWMLAEALIDGFQVNVDGYVRDDQVHLLGIVDAVMYPGTDAFMRWDYPSRLPAAWQDKIRLAAIETVRALKFDHGLFNVELRVCTHSGECKVIEMNPRMAAQFSDMYEMVDGVNLHELALDLALDRPPQGAIHPRTAKAASSFVYRRFDGAPQPDLPATKERHALTQFDPRAQLMVFEKRGNELRREMKWLKSYRYACLNLGADSEVELDQKYLRASALLGLPPVCVAHEAPR